jgi:hypothetical protein
MAATRRLDAKKLVSFEEDYYGILAVDPATLPSGSEVAARREAAGMLEKAYQAACRRYHPDVNRTDPDAEAKFRLAIKAHTVLSDPIARRYYDSKGADRSRTLEMDGKRYEIDWENLGYYRQGSTADTVGYGLFFALAERKDELGIKPAFFPELPQHNYEWDFAVPDIGVKLAISIVPDEDDVRRLTSGEDAGRSLPFKIYLCFPRACPYLIKGEDEVYKVGDREVVLPGKLLRTVYVDLELVETTVLDTAQAFVEGDGIAAAMAKLRDGTLLQEQELRDREAGAMNWLDTDALKQVEADRLKEALRHRTPKPKFDPGAADFLKRIPGSRGKV